MTYCGYVALVGRPNVGKSTLLNKILGTKISITSRKPQTTRHRILGVYTAGVYQTIYVDTPGLHDLQHSQLNRYMNRTATAAVNDVDMVIMVADATRWTEEDECVVERLKSISTPIYLVLNKVDKIKNKDQLLPMLKHLSTLLPFKAVFPISAKAGINIQRLTQEVEKQLPQAPHLFPQDELTDRSERFLVAELIREKVIRNVGQELPYATTVAIEQFEQGPENIRISALIWVEKRGHKAIVIGKGGSRLKTIGTDARRDIERLLQHKVFLTLWVKVKEGWLDDARALDTLGYSDL